MSTEDVARRLSRGYNEWIKAHGPDADGARPGGNHLWVVQDGIEYRVTIEPRDHDHPAGYRAVMRRTCGLLNCTDPDHLVLSSAEAESVRQS